MNLTIICGIDEITVLSYGKNFSSLYVMILPRDNRHMSRDNFFLLQTMSHGTATFILKYEN